TNSIPETWLPDSVGTLLTERAIDGMMELLTGSVQWRGDDANTVTSEGVIRVTNGHVLVDSNHPPLTNLSGGIVFESNLVRLIDIKGTLASSKVSLKEATLEWKDSDVWADLHGNGLFAAHDVYQALLRDPRSTPLQESLSLYHDAQGQLGISTHIQGPLSNPAQLHVLQGNLWLKNFHLFPVLNGLAPQHINGQFSFDDQGIRIQSFNGQLGESPVEIKGQWSFRKDSQASNATIASHLSSNDFKTLLPSIGENFSVREGPIDITITLSGSSLRPTYQGTIDLTNAALIAKKVFFQKPSGVSTTIDLKGNLVKNAIQLTKGTLSIPPYTLDAQGQLSWSDPPSIHARFQTESGTGALFPEGVIIGDGRLHFSKLGIIWDLEGKDWDWTTWTMKGKVEGSNRNSQTTTSNEKEDSQLASLQWAQKNQKGKGEITLKRVPIGSLLGSQSNSPQPLTGTTFLTTSLHMDLESSEQMQRSLTGKGHAQIQKGLIQTGPVLSKILGILNVPSLLMGKVNLLEEGLPFDELTGTFSIDNGLLTTKDFALKSPVIKLTAAGTYDLPTENLESMIAVSPFGAYSNLLKDIPLFGSLMQGERKGVLTALFEVKGPRTKPEVTYLPLDSFTGGMKGLAQVPIDMLKNIITLPLPEKEKPGQGTLAR
ncbi:MAG: AsmA-like C-terminal domain-containing protein, partial [Nitrospirota bacterium]|nr:AsmA-like C-terminal domain-containing protein [Nitrospirota bacterium]